MFTVAGHGVRDEDTGLWQESNHTTATELRHHTLMISLLPVTPPKLSSTKKGKLKENGELQIKGHQLRASHDL